MSERKVIATRPTDSLIPHPQQSLFADLPQTEFQELKASVKSRGICTPLCVTEDNVILCGHTRHRAAVELGFTEVPVTVVSGLSVDEQLVHIVTDNMRRRHLTPTQRALFWTNPALKPVHQALGIEMKERLAAGRKKGGRIAGRGRPKDSSQEKLPGSYPDSPAVQARDPLAKMAKVSARTITDAQKVWAQAPEKAKASIAGQSEEAVSGMARDVRIQEKAAAFEPDPSDFTSIVMSSRAETPGAYRAKFLGAAKEPDGGILFLWHVFVSEESEIPALFAESVPDDCDATTQRLHRKSRLGRLVDGMTGFEPHPEVDLRPFVAEDFQITISGSGRSLVVESIRPDIQDDLEKGEATEAACGQLEAQLRDEGGQATVSGKPAEATENQAQAPAPESKPEPMWPK